MCGTLLPAAASLIFVGVRAQLLVGRDVSTGAIAMSEVQGASVSGRIVGSDRKEPVQGVRVELVSDEAITGSPSTLTTDRGEFVFENVPPGRYWVRAGKVDWPFVFWGQDAPEDEAESILLRPGEHRQGFEIALSRLGALVGHVADENGERIAGALVTAQGDDLEVAHTDERGEFRVPRLQPGLYIVSATTLMRGREFPALVSPSVSVALSTGGDESIGELVVVSQKGYEVRGRVVAAAEFATNSDVVLLQEHSGTRTQISAARAAATALPTGEFSFSHIPNGRYLLRATQGTLSGETQIEVSGNNLGAVSIPLQATVALAGTLTLNRSDQCRSPIVRALPIAGSMSTRVPVDASVVHGRFRFPSLIGVHQLEVHCENRTALVERIAVGDKNWVVGSVVDTARIPLNAEINIVARLSMNRISGKVYDAHRRPVGGRVAIVTADIGRWRPPFQHVWILHVVDGVFFVDGLPPGNYHVFHEPSRRLSEVQSPGYLRRVISKRATSITVEETGEVAVEVRVP